MNPFGEQKNLGLLFALFARAQTNAHVHFRERERAENEKQKSFPTSERLRDLALSLDKVVC